MSSIRTGESHTPELPNAVLVRHGHSAGNAGKKTAGFAGIPLEESGHQQSRTVAAQIVERFGVDSVSHIITTPYLRAQQTAAPLIALTGIEPLTRAGWREITYLQPSKADGKTYGERVALRDAFWTSTMSNPEYTDKGEQSVDSANSFMRRVRASLIDLATLAASSEGVVVVYAHEFPISAAVNVAQGKTDDEIIADMALLQKPSPRIENTQAIGLTMIDGMFVLAQDTDIDLFPESRLEIQ